MENNTLIEYLYRDGSNYKMRNFCIVSGTITKKEIDIIMDTLLDGEYFIPAVVGLPEERFGSWTEDDTQFFELDRHGFSPTDREPSLPISVNELVERFRAAKDNWSLPLTEDAKRRAVEEAIGVINENMPQADRCELFGCLVDVVEDWLSGKGFTVKDFPNEDREGDPDEAIIYGDDYDHLADRFAEVIGINRDLL